MSSIRRSRSPVYRRDYPLGTSSSGGSVSDTRTPYSSRRQNKSERGRRNSSRERVTERETLRDKDERTRVTSAERGNEKYSIHDKYRKNKQSRETRAESPEEESYLKPVTLHKGHENVDEYMLDPSTCNFRGASHPVDDDVVLVPDEPPLKTENTKNIKDDGDNRLERLEKLVELLVTNNSKSQPIETNTNTLQEKSWLSVNNKAVLELVPRNTNFTTSMWLNRIHEECIERNFDEKTSIQFLESNMTGIIKAWYKTIPAYDFSWPELKMLITKTFPDNTDFAYTLKLLVERNKKPEESVTQYYFSKMYLLEACKISGANAVSCLIDGLENESFKQEAKSHNFLTPEALYSQFLLKFSFDHIQEVIPEPNEYEEIYTTEPAYIENHQNSDYRKANIKAKKCFTCGKKGHLTVHCRHAPRCYSCSNEGHIAINCPMKYHKILMMSGKNELDKSNYILCYVNRKKLHAYVDTGCSVITIKECVVRDLKLKFNSSQQLIWGYGGGFVRALGEVELLIKIDLVECTLPAIVVPDTAQTVPLIIGQPLLNKRDVVMVFQNSGIRLFEKKLDESDSKNTVLTQC